MATPSGGVLLSLVLTELVCNMIDRKFLKGFIWSVFGVLLSLFGFMHGNNFELVETPAVAAVAAVAQSCSGAAGCADYMVQASCRGPG